MRDSIMGRRGWRRADAQAARELHGGDDLDLALEHDEGCACSLCHPEREPEGEAEVNEEPDQPVLEAEAEEHYPGFIIIDESAPVPRHLWNYFLHPPKNGGAQ